MRLRLPLIVCLVVLQLRRHSANKRLLLHSEHPHQVHLEEVEVDYLVLRHRLPLVVDFLDQHLHQPPEGSLVSPLQHHRYLDNLRPHQLWEEGYSGPRHRRNQVDFSVYHRQHLQ